MLEDLGAGNRRFRRATQRITGQTAGSPDEFGSAFVAEPELDRLVIARGGEALAVGAE
jgi:hypothetical protein